MDANDDQIIYPIPLRPGVAATVKVPKDLTRDEAEKIARVLVALAFAVPTGDL